MSTQFKISSLFLAFSLTYLYLISMCLILIFFCKLSAAFRVFTESILIADTFKMGILILHKRHLIHNILCPAVNIFTNSALVVLSITKSCYLNCYLIGEFLIYTICSTVVLFVMGSLAQLASQYSHRSKL
jgi:hypothetical protein